MNDWFDYAKDRRTQLVADPISHPESPNDEALRWATFCTASVEWLCERYGVPCSPWVHTSPTACRNPGLTRLTRINHRCMTGSSNIHPSHSPGAISIVTTACSLISTNSLNNIVAFLPLCLPKHLLRARESFYCADRPPSIGTTCPVIARTLKSQTQYH